MGGMGAEVIELPRPLVEKVRELVEALTMGDVLAIREAEDKLQDPTILLQLDAALRGTGARIPTLERTMVDLLEELRELEELRDE